MKNEGPRVLFIASSLPLRDWLFRYGTIFCSSTTYFSLNHQQRLESSFIFFPMAAAAVDGGVNSDAGDRRMQSLDWRSFWRAGSYEVPVSSLPQQDEFETSDFNRARVHPKFLHSNATSHKWAFGAVAELLDNAVDEIANGASFIIVDKFNDPRDNSPMLLFQDDGGGMDPEGVRRCMSLGYSSKRSKKTIGQYGNGFKTSTMRLGADAIVFTCASREGHLTQSIGLLSYTFLRQTMKDDIVVPMIDFQLHEKNSVPILYSSQEDWDSNLSTILKWSPFSSKDELIFQFSDIGSHGTKVLVYNLWMNDDCLLELDFDDDDEDIVLRDQTNPGGLPRSHKDAVLAHLSHIYKFSLRAYISILYLRKFPKFQIILRGKPVEQVDLVDEMKSIKVRTYKPYNPTGSEDVIVKTTIGFAKEAPVLGIFGFNVYHKNRLIMPFWKVHQDGSSRGRCVLGFLEANFMEPAHDKQDFERTPLFIRLEAKLKQMVVEFWANNCHLIGYKPMNAEARKRQRGSDNFTGVASNEQKHVTNLSTCLEKGLQRNKQGGGYRSVKDIIVIADTDGSDKIALTESHDQQFVKDASMSVDFDETETFNVNDPTLIMKLTEENLQLLSRRDEMQCKEEELNQMIGELESKLEVARRKHLSLVAEVEMRRKKLTV